MKLLLISVFMFLANFLFAQITFQEWEEESKTNKRLLPRYGFRVKSAEEIKNDSAFIKEIMEQPQFKNRREASDHLISLGFRYYYRPDFKTAMYRFNQAYLLDSTNTDIFWGYGAIYMAMGKLELAKEQYEIGLKLNPRNTHLMTDLATYYMGQYYTFMEMPKSDIITDPSLHARQKIDSALLYLNRSYQIDPKDVNTTYKLSISYYNISDCENAWKYYDLAMELGGRPVTEEYTKDLKKKCKK